MINGKGLPGGFMCEERGGKERELTSRETERVCAWEAEHTFKIINRTLGLLQKISWQREALRRQTKQFFENKVNVTMHILVWLNLFAGFKNNFKFLKPNVLAVNWLQ